MTPKSRLGRWLLKCADRLLVVVIAYVVAVILGSTVFWLIELRGRGYSWLQAVYWGQVTGTSTGYGDIAPVSVAGMLLSIAYLFVVTMFLLAVLVANLVTKLLPNPHLFTDDEQKEILRRLRRIERRQSWMILLLKLIAAALRIKEIPPLPDDDADET